MEDVFILSVLYGNEMHDFEAELQVFGYSYKIAVKINNTIVFFEPDEERNYRAVLADPALQKNMDIVLLKAVSAKLEELFK